MTLDEFRAKYRLQKRLTQRGVASYQAVDSSGRVVMVHSLDSAPRDEVDHVRSLVHRLDAVDHKKILEILDVDGAPVLVTEYLQGFQTLAHWLEIRTRSTPTAPTAQALQPNRPPRGEFTQLFGPAEVPKTPVLERPAAANSPTASAQPPPAAAVAKAQSSAPETPPPGAGEFPGPFGPLPDRQGGGLESPAPAASRGETATPTVPPATPATAKSASPPGDFTQLFRPGASAPTAVPSEPPPAPNSPPTPSQPERPKVVVRWRDGPPAESPPPSPGKPLIRWKQGGPAEDIGRSERPAASPPPPSAPGGFTRLFGPQDGLAAAPDSGPANVPPPPAQPPAPDPPLHRQPAHPPRARAGGGGGRGADRPARFTELQPPAADSPGDPTNPPAPAEPA